MIDVPVFSGESFWNQPISQEVRVHQQSANWINLLSLEPTGNLGINLAQYTIPIYEVTEATPLSTVQKRHETLQEASNWRPFYSWVGDLDKFDHALDFNPRVPIPADALPDGASDAHLVLVDWNRRLAWDFWNLKRLGPNEWASRSAISYSLDGDGTFAPSQLKPRRQGDSIHFYGPCRASGVPLLAGLIMHDEVVKGSIAHKLAFACRYPAYREHVFPAIWTDGIFPGGIPEGSLLQLDPALDIESLPLLPGEKVVARALQEYGMVLVDFAGGTVLYGESLTHRPDRSWEGLLSHEGMKVIAMQHFRVLETFDVVPMGDRIRPRKWYALGPQPDYSNTPEDELPKP